MKIMKSISLVATLVVTLVLLSGTALAFTEGSGTEPDPYHIYDATDLKNINTVSNLSRHYILMDDVEITDSTWYAIGNNSSRFTGSFDGNGYTITFSNSSGITFERTGSSSSADGRGLFGNLGGSSKLENVMIIVAADLTGTGHNSGVLLGHANGTSSVKPTIINCSVVATESGGSLSVTTLYQYKTGALIGTLNNSTVQNSYSNLDISNSKGEAGGLVGFANNATIEQSYAFGDVKSDYDAGGLVGNISNTTISNSYALGDVTSSNEAGGLIGIMTYSNISKSYAHGDVKSPYASGGLIGNSTRSNISESYASGNVTTTSQTYYAGGLVGNTRDYTNITNCYATGSVTANNRYAGGLATVNGGNVKITNSYSIGLVSATTSSGLAYAYSSYYNPTVTNSFYDTTTSGKSDDNGNGTPMVTADMMQNSTFSTWDISNEEFGDTVWYIYEGETYPQLTAFHQPETISAATTTDLKHIGSNEIRKDFNDETKAWTLNANYILDGNIDMDGVSITPIGTSSAPFTGTFTGSEDFAFAISNLVIDESGDNVGLFGYTEDAEFSNIHLIDASVSGNMNVGTLIGRAAGTTEISQSFATGTVNAAANHAGGLVGNFADGFISQCYTDVDVTAGTTEAGGLVGVMRGGSIFESYATGGIEAATEVAGGLIGEYAATTDLTIENSFALNEFVNSPADAGRVIGIILTGADFYPISVYAWDAMENADGDFESADAVNGDDITSEDVWNTFDDSGSVWSSFDVSVWELGTSDVFLLPVFSFFLNDWVDDLPGDASHLIPEDEVDEGTTKKGSGGSGTGSATVVNSTSTTTPSTSDSGSSSGSADAQDPITNAPQGETDGNQGFGTSVDDGESGSRTTLVGLLIVGFIVVVLAVALFVKGRKF
ncbi:hypothetical protein MmiHf6_13480 [Methanimicrococcus hongohii]|uniref:GLUG domain-containing protein n=1 Tax=Methanimicrococcus hongohii TaxID=3028295 RepID=A0AA97A2F6_9EURY|nr:GLUG motif-containing protein [Methanimicrococcus sp. Hf6]WNY24023.1 hypothetical protein MmiHf6_13480 [Methanimicrococcus sp. Hf6]